MKTFPIGATVPRKFETTPGFDTTKQMEDNRKKRQMEIGIMRHIGTIDVETSGTWRIIFDCNAKDVVPADEAMPISCLSLDWKRRAR